MIQTDLFDANVAVRVRAHRSMRASVCSFLVAAFAVGGATRTVAQEFDLIVTDGRIIDGGGNPWYRADLGIKDGKIARIGDLSDAKATERIAAKGRVVTPGFIDMMGQDTLVYVTDRAAAESKLRQGITTHLSGEGGSEAPQNRHTQPDPVDVGGEKVRWTRFSEFFALLEKNGLPLNVAYNVGAAQVRRIVIGEVERVPAAAELQQMKDLVKQAMEDGAMGVSTALIYPPGSYAKTDELIELAKAAAPYGGYYATHMRNESFDLLTSIDEAIQIGRSAGVPVQIYHLKAAGKDNWPLMSRAIARIDAAREQGVDVTADVYPYIRNGIGLRSFLPPRHYAKGEHAFITTLSNAAVRRQLRTEVESESREWENWYHHVGKDWNNVLIVDPGTYPDPSIAGLSLAEAAKRSGKDAWDLFFDLVQAADVFVAPQSMNEGQKQLALEAPWMMIDSDSSPINPAAAGSAHPRAFGAFPRVIAKYVREDGVLTLEEAVRRMTSLAANRLGLYDRGRLAPGMAADIAIFDPQKLHDRATFVAPTLQSEGIDYLLVNGGLVIRDGQLTAALPGKVLRNRSR